MIVIFNPKADCLDMMNNYLPAIQPIMMTDPPTDDTEAREPTLPIRPTPSTTHPGCSVGNRFIGSAEPT